MNCKECEDRLALYLGGDLPRDEAALVERHFGECPGCQVFASGLKEAQALLQESHREPLAAAHFAAVRARVLAELERERRPFWKRGWVFGFAAVAAALLVIASALLPQARSRLAPVTKVQPSVVAREHLPAQVESATKQGDEGVPSGSGGPPHKRRVRPRVVVGEPVLIKVVSDNPDVVIYWIADTRGD
jgi:anti-sigma factor RsiW